MLHNKLIDRTEIAKYRQISKTVYNDVLDAQILDAQLQDIAPLLGERLYNDIQANPTNYTALLDGGNYTYNGISYVNYGLKACLAYYAYARYAMFGKITDTPFGMVEKTGENSISLTESQRKARYTEDRDSAFTIWKSVENFIIRTQVPLFIRDVNAKQPNQNFKIRKICN